MKLKVHWNKKHWEQERENSSKLQQKAFAYEISWQEYILEKIGDHLVSNTRINTKLKHIELYIVVEIVWKAC